MFAYYYLFLISLGGFFILLFFSIMSFRNNEALEIKTNKNKNSGWMCLIDSIIYLIIAIFINYKHKKELNERDGYIAELAETRKITIELNENRYRNYEYSEQSRHSRLPDNPNDEGAIKPEKAIIEEHEENIKEKIDDENNINNDNNNDKNNNNEKGVSSERKDKNKQIVDDLIDDKDSKEIKINDINVDNFNNDINIDVDNKEKNDFGDDMNEKDE